jgi:hypothetical protein
MAIESMREMPSKDKKRRERAQMIETRVILARGGPHG